MTETAKARYEERPFSGFSPDFCDIRVVFLSVIAAQLLSLVIVLLRYPSFSFWSELSLISLYVQLLVLCNLSLMCQLGKRLRGRPELTVYVSTFVLVLIMTLLIGELIFLVSRGSAIEAVLSDHDHILYLGKTFAITAVIAAIMLRYLYIQKAWRDSMEVRNQARIEALQARIRPHFLFNSMNTIASLTRSDPETAEKVVEDLADLFRAALSDVSRLSTLGNELSLCRQYLGIEKLRLGARLDVHWAVDELPEKAGLPALSLQPLLENAVYHGIEPGEAGGLIDIQGRLEDGMVVMTISNPPPPEKEGIRNSLHMALENTRERLALAYQGQATLQTRQQGRIFEVRITFPYQEQGSGDSDR